MMYRPRLQPALFFIFISGISGLAVSGQACTPLPAQSDQACDKIEKSSSRRSCYQKQFDTADQELNTTYRRLLKRLAPAIATEMREDSRNWIRMKEYNCGFRSEMLREADEDQRRIEFLSCALGYTTARTEYLKRAFGQEGVAAKVAGMYDDGFDGSLEWKAVKKDEKQSSGQEFEFRIEVVRGPTAHLGEINGRVFISENNRGVYEERPNCSGIKNAALTQQEPCCRLDFQLSENKGYRTIEVRETDCGYYHGARAYFDGRYRKIR